jgi:hypothetical protein
MLNKYNTIQHNRCTVVLFFLLYTVAAATCHCVAVVAAACYCVPIVAAATTVFNMFFLLLL